MSTTLQSTLEGDAAQEATVNILETLLRFARQIDPDNRHKLPTDTLLPTTEEDGAHPITSALLLVQADTPAETYTKVYAINAGGLQIAAAGAAFDKTVQSLTGGKLGACPVPVEFEPAVMSLIRMLALAKGAGVPDAAGDLQRATDEALERGMAQLRKARSKLN